MYTFQPLVDTAANDHTGFYFFIVVAVVLLGLLIMCWNSSEISSLAVIVWLVIMVGFGVIGYNASFAPEKTYSNQKVVGEFVSFTPEVWTERSGKNSYTVKRQMYVTYRVGNDMVVLSAESGVTYPTTVQLYKN